MTARPTPSAVKSPVALSRRRPRAVGPVPGAAAQRDSWRSLSPPPNTGTTTAGASTRRTDLLKSPPPWCNDLHGCPPRRVVIHTPPVRASRVMPQVCGRIGGEPATEGRGALVPEGGRWRRALRLPGMSMSIVQFRRRGRRTPARTADAGLSVCRDRLWRCSLSAWLFSGSSAAPPPKLGQPGRAHGHDAHGHGLRTATTDRRRRLDGARGCRSGRPVERHGRHLRPDPPRSPGRRK